VYAFALAATLALTASSALFAVVLLDGPRPGAVFERVGAGLLSLVVRGLALELRALLGNFSRVKLFRSGFSCSDCSLPNFPRGELFASGFAPRPDGAVPKVLTADAPRENVFCEDVFFSEDPLYGLAEDVRVRGRFSSDAPLTSPDVRLVLPVLGLLAGFPVGLPGGFAERFAAGGAEFFEAGFEAVAETARPTAREVFFETERPSNVLREGGLGPAAARPLLGRLVKGFADVVLAGAGAFLSKNFSSPDDLLLEAAPALRLGLVLNFALGFGLGLVLRRDEGIERDCFMVSFQ
jgi:hypothetical protein